MGLYDELQVSVKDYLDMSKGSTDKVTKQLSRASEVAANSADIYTQIGNLQAVSKIAEQSGELNVQQANLRAASALGVDPEAKGGVIIEDLVKLKESKKAVEENLLGLQEIENRSPLKDPIGYIKGHIFDKPEKEKALSQAVARTTLYQNSLQGTQAAMQQATSTNLGLKQTFNAESIAANAQVLRLASNLQANQAELQSIQYNIEGVTQARKAAAEELSARYQGVNAENSQKHLDLAIADSKRREQEWTVRKVLLDDQLAERELKLESGKLFEAKINEGRKLSGENPLTRVEIEEAKKVFGTDAGRKFEVYWKIGDSVLSNKPEGRFGHTPAGAIKTFSELDVQLGPEAEDTKALLARAKAKLLSLSPEKRKADNLTEDKTHGENVSNFLNKEVNKMVTDMSSVITPDASNLRYIGALNDYLVKPEFARLPVVSKLLKPLMNQGVTLTDMNHVIDLQVAAIKSGNLTQSEAVQFAQVIQRADQIKRASRQFSAMGIQVPNTYNVSVQVPTGLYQGRMHQGVPVPVTKLDIVNLADPIKYQEVLVKKMAANAKF